MQQPAVIVQKMCIRDRLEVSQDDPLHLCILITAYYGLRRSEVLGLKWSSIDFERKSITINHKVTEQLVNGKYVPVVSDVMKNKTSCRTLPLIPAVEEELLKQKEKQQLYRKLFKKSYSTEYLDFVCTDQEGKLIRPNFVTAHFDWLLTKSGLKHLRFHDLRHSCASQMCIRDRQNTNKQNTNKQNTKRQSTNLSGQTDESADFDQMEAQVREEFRERLEIDTLAQRYDHDKLEELLDNIVAVSYTHLDVYKRQE